MDEIDIYLAQAEACLKELASAPGDAPMLAQKQYEYAQLMCAIGKQKEAEPILHAAKDMLQDYREDDIYSGLYYSLSSQYAIVLDYLGYCPAVCPCSSFAFHGLTQRAGWWQSVRRSMRS